jgi:hypothetical protein
VKGKSLLYDVSTPFHVQHDHMVRSYENVAYVGDMMDFFAAFFVLSDHTGVNINVKDFRPIFLEVKTSRDDTTHCTTISIVIVLIILIIEIIVVLGAWRTYR